MDNENMLSAATAGGGMKTLQVYIAMTSIAVRLHYSVICVCGFHVKNTSFLKCKKY